MHSSARSDEGLMRRELSLRALGVVATRDRRDADGQDCLADDLCITAPTAVRKEECGQTERSVERGQVMSPGVMSGCHLELSCPPSKLIGSHDIRVTA